MEYKLEKLIDSVSIKHPFSKKNVVFLNTSDIEEGNILKKEYSKIDDLPGQAKKSIQPNDILYSEIRPKNKRYAYINFECDDYVVSTKLMVLRNINPDLVHSKYLYYFLIDQKTVNYLQNIAESRSGTFPQITFSEVKNLKLDLPSIEKQITIINIMDTLNEKINNNNKIIANLEELSQTLFKRWFVDFEFPDENGTPYKSSGGEMIDSELGKIPSNWKIYKLKDIASHKKETFNPKKSKEVIVKHFSLPAYDNEEQAIEEEVNKIKSNKWIINNNCVLFSKMNPDTKRIWLPVIDNKKLNVASSEFVVMESPNNKTNSFIYNICLNSQFIDYLKANTTGSTNSRQRVKPTIAVNYKLAIEDSIVKKYSEIITPYMEEMKILRSEIGKLTQLRDTLLPKLMSGEIEIPDDIEVNNDELSI
ncbi:restriction endonuclease subunit S [Staphylococcus hominis]|uniref:restriction endonuclease subunit S n=1 Tax=Staphylococcus hominis TaxID=1290 RepID=UPI000D1F4E08|nr:restriction endonuclease subunit S [Staphylococcus hominis]PTK42912.1 restriction endonuclease subunit S [Staphylococcus hominis]